MRLVFVAILLCWIVRFSVAVHERQQQQSPELKENAIEAIDWFEMDWQAEKKAPQQQSKTKTRARPEFPVLNPPVTPRRASAPQPESKHHHHHHHSREKTVTNRASLPQLQARRHNSAPLLQIKIATQVYTPPVNLNLATSGNSDDKDVILASPIDYFDPRLARSSTPIELREVGISKETVAGDIITGNFREGYLTCSLCMHTVGSIEQLQTHLEEHLLI